MRTKNIPYFFLAIFVLFWVRAALIQLTPQPKLQGLYERQSQKTIALSGNRGTIFDRNGTTLAISNEGNSIAAHPKFWLKDQSRFFICKALKMSCRALDQTAKNSNKSFFWVKRYISDSEKKILDQRVFGKKKHTPSIWIVKETARAYPNESIAKDLIGRVNIDHQGITGLELFFNQRLKGEDLKIVLEKDAKGRLIDPEDKSKVDAKSGENIVLTFDLRLLEKHQALAKAHFEKWQAQSVEILILNAKGEILSAAQYPSSSRFRPFLDRFEPGSSIKPIWVGLALEHGLSSKEKFFVTKKPFKLKGGSISEAHADFEGKMDLKELIIRSSNIASAKLALKTKEKVFIEFFSKFPEFQFPGFKKSNFFNGRWEDLRLANAGFGQGFMVSGIEQIWALQNLVLKEIFPIHFEKKLDESNDGPHSKKSLISKKNRDFVFDALLKTVEVGTAKSASLEHFLTFGKTATAQVVDPKTKSYSKSHYRSSFLGGIMGAHVEETLFAWVSIDGPKTAYYASEVAAPLFKEVMESAVQTMTVTPILSKAKVETKNPIQKGKLSHSEPKIDLLEKSDRMPELKNLDPKTILQWASSVELQVQFKGSGVSKTQSIQPGESIQKGQKLDVYLE